MLLVVARVSKSCNVCYRHLFGIKDLRAPIHVDCFWRHEIADRDVFADEPLTNDFLIDVAPNRMVVYVTEREPRGFHGALERGDLFVSSRRPSRFFFERRLEHERSVCSTQRIGRGTCMQAANVRIQLYRL